VKALFFTPAAVGDLEQILDYIAVHRPLTAKKVVAKIREKCAIIATHPEIGQRRPEFPGNYRSSVFQRWVIFYRVVDDTVEIHRVLDGSRDIDGLMS
jgi:toxin ParE1/3/4